MYIYKAARIFFIHFSSLYRILFDDSILLRLMFPYTARKISEYCKQSYITYIILKEEEITAVLWKSIKKNQQPSSLAILFSCYFGSFLELKLIPISWQPQHPSPIPLLLSLCCYLSLLRFVCKLLGARICLLVLCTTHCTFVYMHACAS